MQVVILMLVIGQGGTDVTTTVKTLVADTKVTWTGLAKDMEDIESPVQEWKAVEQPFPQMLYQLQTTAKTFAEAAVFCQVQDSDILGPDADAVIMMKDLKPNTEVWITDKDTRPLRIMEPGDRQARLNEAQCYLIKKSTMDEISTRKVDCNMKHRSVCTKPLKSYQNIMDYQNEITEIREIGKTIAEVDQVLVDAIGKTLEIGEEDETNHPAKLQTTANLLIQADDEINKIKNDLPTYPRLITTSNQLQNVRNRQMTVLLLILTQHMENYANKVDAITSISGTGNGSNEAGGEAGEPITNDLIDIRTDMNTLESDLSWAKNKIQELRATDQEVQEKVEANKKRGQIVETNKVAIRRNKSALQTVQEKLNNWMKNIINKVIGRLNENRTNNEDGEFMADGTAQIVQLAMDFLEDETNVWIAAGITLLFTILAIGNAVCICVYVVQAKKTRKGTKRVKKELRMKEKYQESDEEAKLAPNGDKTRLGRMDDQLRQAFRNIKLLEGKVSETETSLKQITKKIEELERERRKEKPDRK